MAEVSVINKQSIDSFSKSMDWFLYDRDLLHETVKVNKVNSNQNYSYITKYCVSMHLEKTVINFIDFQTSAIPPCTRKLGK